MPPGLVLHQDGSLTGTPTTAGSNTVLVSVVDDGAPTQSASSSLQIIIKGSQ